MALEIKVPAVGESISEVTISRWLKQSGDYVQMDEVLCELESDKATFELNAEAAGVLKTNGNEGDTIKVGSLICSIDTSAKAPAVKSEPFASPKAETQKQEAVASQNYATGHPSPAAQKILSEKGIAPAAVSGTGKDGRITKEDAEQAQPAKKSETKPSTINAPILSGSREERHEKMNNLRKTISKRLVAVKNETAMLTTFNEVDMKSLMDLRSSYKEKFKEKHGIGLGFMSFFTKAVCEALKEFPAVNAMISGEEIIYHQYCDISIAVSAPKGLVVPVVRNAESMTLADIERSIASLAAKARENHLIIIDKFY